MSPKLPALAAGLMLLAAPAAATAKPATSCDPFGTKACLMPWPNDMNLTVRDRSSETGLRLRLPRAGFPANKQGVRANPAEWNRSDGFSPGGPILVQAPGVSLNRSKLVQITDLSRYKAKDAGLVVIDAKTRRRQLVWAEVDVTARRKADRLLMIHPAKNFAEGHRYIVALRGLRDARGRALPVADGFRALLAGRGPKRHRARYRGILATLKKAGVPKKGLWLAWDFTVSSQQNLERRMLAIRDDAFRRLGDANLADGVVQGAAPQVTITSVNDATGDPRIARRISGTFTVPCYLNQAGCPVGARLNYASASKDAVPVQEAGNTMQARLECEIPRAALDQPARIAMYGHGLLGSGNQIDEDNIRSMAAEHDFAFCATDWVGFARDDIPQAIKALGDIGQFPAIPDRIQQGWLNQLYLGRLMLHPQGLAAQPAFQGAGGRPLIDTTELFYDGNSQGGIMGGALTTIAPDFRKAVLGVPGMTFSTLLERSVDWDVYAKIFYPAYPQAADRPLALALIQVVWDRGEPDGWVAHLQNDPPPNTPSHVALLMPSVGDWQVSNWQADAMARTIGAAARQPAIAKGRTVAKTPLYGIPAITSWPWTKSAIEYWDAGADFVGITPAENVAPHQGHDSHYAVRNSPLARLQKSEFLKPGGAIVDVCPKNVPCEGADDDTP